LPEALRKDSEKGFLLAAFANQLAAATERVLLAQAVRRTEREAAAERVRNSLLSAVSHDLKTPLTSMIAAGSTLLRNRATLDDEAVDALLGDIVGEGERLTQLIANVLSVSRLESPTVDLRRVPQPLDEVLASVVDRVASRFRGTEVHVDVPDDLPFVSVEPLLIEQVLWNLLENSIRHGGEGVTLELRARTAEHMVTVQVADDGPGIPEADRDKVFEKFYRGAGARTADGGVGLGLTICRAIVHAHGGRIAARAGVGGGAFVEFTLPAVAGTPSVAGASLESEGAVTR
jgi:two-component system sensor histidine kinase KdpD